MQQTHAVLPFQKRSKEVTLYHDLPFSQVKQYLDGEYSLPRAKPDWMQALSGSVVAGVRCRGIALRDIPLLGKGPGLEMFEDRRQRLRKGVGWAFGTCQNTKVAETLPRESVHFMVAIKKHEWLPLERRKDPRWCWRSHFRECFAVTPPVSAGNAIGRGLSNMETPLQKACLQEISKRPFWTALKNALLQGKESPAKDGTKQKPAKSKSNKRKGTLRARVNIRINTYYACRT